ncbi:hypothetical protein [Actinoallomurus sp. CA-142502]|uniref:hypothetical protein n=1 Tax=Actinoallomurus sp. CA-142502 TaxID=3239885 RepID=UPI003D8F6C74
MSRESPASAVDLERERVRDPVALVRERDAPPVAERLAERLRPITPERAARNAAQLATALQQATPVSPESRS